MNDGTTFSWQTKKAFIEIKSNIDLREEDIGAAVTETTIEDDDNKMSFTIDPDTIHFTGLSYCQSFNQITYLSDIIVNFYFHKFYSKT